MTDPIRPRVVRFSSRNPAVVVLVLVVLLVLVAALLTVGLAVAAGLAVVGGAGLLARRAFGRRLSGPRPPPIEGALDPRLEVLPPAPPSSPPDRLGDGR